MTLTCQPASWIFGPVFAPMSVGPNTMARLEAFILFEEEASWTRFKCRVSARRVA